MHACSLALHRRAFFFWLATIAAGLSIGATAHPAAADTVVSSNITSDTTWTAAASPYVLDNSISVGSGVTLTIEPGVTVEFNVGGLSQLIILGTLSAVGQPDNHIVFTSTQGAAGEGAPGQYGGIVLDSGNAQSRFSYADFLYGGYGSGGYYAYGVLEVGSGSSTSIDHSTFEHNEYSGLTVGTDDAVDVSYSTFSFNGDGIAVLGNSPGPLTLSDSHIDNNVADGLFFNFGNSGTVGSTITSNEIAQNGAVGIQVEPWDCSIPTSAWPHGEGNDIYGNGDPNAAFPADGTQLGIDGWPPCHALPIDWDDNYWGDVQLIVGPDALPGLACDDTQPAKVYEASPAHQPSGYLAYSNHDPYEVPPGPVNTSESDTFFSCTTGFGTWTLADIDNAVYIHSFSSTPFNIP